MLVWAVSWCALQDTKHLEMEFGDANQWIIVIARDTRLSAVLVLSHTSVTNKCIGRAAASLEQVRQGI